MKQHAGHIVQLCAVVSGLAGLVRTLDSPLTAGLLLGGVLAWVVGKYIQEEIVSHP